MFFSSDKEPNELISKGMKLFVELKYKNENGKSHTQF